jgi:polysaccharide biosynthesis transport protein
MHGDAQSGGSGGSGRVRRTRRQHLVLIVVLGLAGMVAGAGLTVGRPATYQATASVLVDPLVGNPFAPGDEEDPLPSLETEAEVLRSDEVTRLALSRLPKRLSRSALQDHVAVSVPENTRILEVTFTATSRVLAREGAQAYATAYLDRRRRRAREATTGPLAGVEEQTRAVLAALRTAGAAAPPGSAEERASTGWLTEALNDELVRLRASGVGLEHTLLPPGRVLAAAETPPPLGTAERAGFPLAGLAGGLLVGLVLALGRARRGRREDGVADATDRPG